MYTNIYPQKLKDDFHQLENEKNEMEAEFIKRGSSDAESEVRVCNTCTCTYIIHVHTSYMYIYMYVHVHVRT